MPLSECFLFVVCIKFKVCSSFYKYVYILAGAFLATVAGISAFIGFGATLSRARKTDPKYFSKGKIRFILFCIFE